MPLSRALTMCRGQVSQQNLLPPALVMFPTPRQHVIAEAKVWMKHRMRAEGVLKSSVSSIGAERAVTNLGLLR